MSQPRPLFLYIEGALDDKIVRRLRRAGYEPIKVRSLDDVKQMEVIPLASLNAINRAAMETISSCTQFASGIPEAFGRRVAKVLSQ